MTRPLSSLALLALLALTGPARAGEPPVYADPPVALAAAAPEARPADPRRSTVHVTRDLGHMRECGTGTVIAAEGGKSLVLTNAHVVPDGRYPVTIVHETDGQMYSMKARYVAGSAVSDTGPQSIHVNGPDLCILQVDYELPAVEIAAEVPAVGTRVVQYGFGGRAAGHQPTEKHGLVEAPRLSSACIATTIVSQSGDSGAGIFDERGRLVGVCWGGGNIHGQIGVRLDEVHTFTVTTLTERKGLFARFRDRLAARRIAKELVRNPAPASAAPAACPGGVCRPGGVGGFLPPCPGGQCPGGCACQGNGSGRVCPRDCPVQAPAPPAFSPSCPGGVCRPQAPTFTPGVGPSFGGGCAGGGCPGGFCPSPSRRGFFRR